MAKILIVEDNEMNRDMLSRRLAKRGYQVITAIDGPSGLATARRDRPDLIIMDMSLPEMNGWETTRSLRTDPEIQHIPVIALTAHAMAGDREKSLDAGCDDYDIKPIEFPRLTQKIDSLLRTGRRT